jgi:hypothetical protein
MGLIGGTTIAEMIAEMDEFKRTDTFGKEIGSCLSSDLPAKDAEYNKPEPSAEDKNEYNKMSFKQYQRKLPKFLK